MVILDTCAIIEAFKNKPTFSAETLKKIEKGAFVLSVSFAEIACKIKLGKLHMEVSPRILFQELSQVKGIQIVDISVEEWLDSIELTWPENKDPAGRIITAYAIKHNLSIVTTDKQIKVFYKKIIW